MTLTPDWQRRDRNASEARRWQKSQELLAAAEASSRKNAQQFLAVLHQYQAPAFAVYFQPQPAAAGRYELIAERGWMIEPPRLPRKPGILLTESGHFYWYFHLRNADRFTKGVKHARFFEACYHPDRPGLEVSPFMFSDLTTFGAASGIAAQYLEQLIELLVS